MTLNIGYLSTCLFGKSLAHIKSLSQKEKLILSLQIFYNRALEGLQTHIAFLPVVVYIFVIILFQLSSLTKEC